MDFDQTDKIRRRRRACREMGEDSPSRLNATITAIVVGIYVVGVEAPSVLGRRGHGRSSLGAVRKGVRRAAAVVVVVADGRAAAVVAGDVQGGERRRRRRQRRRQMDGDKAGDRPLAPAALWCWWCWWCWLADYEGPIPVTDVALWHRVQLVPANPTGSRPTHSNPRLSPVHSTSPALPPWLLLPLLPLLSRAPHPRSVPRSSFRAE